MYPFLSLQNVAQALFLISLGTQGKQKKRLYKRLGKDCGLRPLEHLAASVQTPQGLNHQEKDHSRKTPFPKTQKPLTPKGRPSGTISKDGRGPAQLVGLLSLSHHSTNLGRGVR